MEPNLNKIETIAPSSASKAEEKMDLQENPIFDVNSAAGDYIFNKKFFVDRSFHESFSGFYDEEDFFHTQEGSFFNQNLEYFNRFGYDKYGGRYNVMGVYIPGEGWNSDFQCYEEDLAEEIFKQQMEEIECVFEEQIKIEPKPCDSSLNSEDLENEDEKDFENEPVDFLKVKDVMEGEAGEEAIGIASAVKNGSEFFVSGSAMKSGANANANVNASASKIMNNNLLENASNVKASAQKAENNFVNLNDNTNNNNVTNFSFNNANNTVNWNSQQKINNANNNFGLSASESGNMQHNANQNDDANYFSEAGNIAAVGIENSVNFGMMQNAVPTPVKINNVHEPTPFKIPFAEVNEENKI